MRGWTMVRDFEGESDLKKTIREEMINKLASEWNDYHQRIEARQFRSQEEIDEENEWIYECLMDKACDAESNALANGVTEEEAKKIRDAAYEAAAEEQRNKENENVTRLHVIEELLHELGARMMRPYEHWNEEERYMEYMETRYDNDERW
jgi:hypothetical protein